ncbi:hypothetical protein ACNI3K_05105 [Demequina sp. SO4-13]|uniref:hypothetical protein n=1 Tax=Demequina sp. SO4-13 TaxID=3401027 RepID=UPI003AF88E6F
MRWEALFSDLEGQLGSAREDEWRAEVSERTRGERIAVDLASRIAAAQGTTLGLVLLDGERITGEVEDSARGWLLLVDAAAREHLVPIQAVASVTGLGRAAHHVTEVERRLGLSHVLRALSRDRSRVRVRTVGGEVHGVIGAVLADHVDVTMDGPGGGRVSVPYATVLEVVSA